MSDFYHRYQHESHGALYAQLMAGEPDQIDALASQWRVMEQTLDDLALSLESDLAKLRTAWESASGEEFQRRVGLIGTYARDLAEGFRKLREGLSMMSGPLRNAQARAEHPDETDDYDKTIKGAVSGMAGGIPGMVIGGFLGHQKDKEEREKARQRMVKLVAELAAEYDVTRESRWQDNVAAPAKLPKGTVSGKVATGTASASTSVSAAPRTGSAGEPGKQDVAASATVHAAPRSGAATAEQGMGAVIDAGTIGTSLAGAGGGGNSVLGAAWTVGAAGTVAAVAGGSARGTLGQPGGNSTASLLGGGAGIGSATGTRGGMEAGRAAMAPGRGVLGGSRGPDLGVRTAGAESGRSAAAPGGANNRSAGGASGRSAAGAGGRSAAVPLGTAKGKDERDERLTWLTEDEIVWQDGGDAPPPVLGNS